MNLIKISLLTLVLALTGLVTNSAPAHAFAKLAVVGDFNFPKLSNNSGSSSGDLGVGAGALLEFDTSMITAFEIGALYHPRKFSAGGFSNTSKYILVPVQFRVHIVPMVVVGAGGYFAKGIGSSASLSFGGVTANGSGGTPDNDYGLMASAGLDLPLAPLFSLVLEGRYLLGLKDVGNSTHWRDTQVLAGVRFGI
ncbi:MAG: outer membrane beta-barrel protein [Methylotenera sp.]|nr:outer membrane beta-barrel protein [Oligoflexia bacterium]